MKKPMSFILSAAVMSMLLVGCSAGTNKSEDVSAEEVPVIQEALDPTAEAEEVTEEDSAGEEAVAEWPRTIVDAAGHEVVLESMPERITLLHTFYLEHLFALGVTPTAASLGNLLGQTESLESSELFAPYMSGVEIMDLGSAREINLEAVLESAPDVIITFSIHGGIDEIYDQLTEIAPVILLDYSDTWQDQLLSCSQIIGKESKAQDVITEVESSIADAGEQVSQYSDRSYALFRTDGKGFIAVGTPSYYETFGLTKPEGYPESSETISLEAVAEMDPYYIVFQHNYEATTAFVQSLESSSVWQSLDAVQNNRIYYFDENMNSNGPLAMKLTAEKLMELYTEE